MSRKLEWRNETMHAGHTRALLAVHTGIPSNVRGLVTPSAEGAMSWKTSTLPAYSAHSTLVLALPAAEKEPRQTFALLHSEAEIEKEQKIRTTISPTSPYSYHKIPSSKSSTNASECPRVRRNDFPSRSSGPAVHLTQNEKNSVTVQK